MARAGNLNQTKRAIHKHTALGFISRARCRYPIPQVNQAQIAIYNNRAHYTIELIHYAAVIVIYIDHIDAASDVNVPQRASDSQQVQTDFADQAVMLLTTRIGINVAI